MTISNTSNPNSRRPTMTRVLVLYYSAYGHIEKMASAVAEGAREAGATVDIKQVPELVPLDEGRTARQGRRRLCLDRDPARRPGNHAVLDHHQPAAFRHDHCRPELRFLGPDGAQRRHRRLALWRDHDRRRRRQPPANRKRAGGRALSRTRDRGDREKTAWLMRRGRHSLRRMPPHLGCGDDGIRHDRNALYLSTGTQSGSGGRATLVVSQPLPRIARQAPLPGMHQVVKPDHSFKW